MSEAFSDCNVVRRAWLDVPTVDELQEEIGSETVEQMLISFQAEVTRRVDELLLTSDHSGSVMRMKVRAGAAHHFCAISSSGFVQLRPCQGV